MQSILGRHTPTATSNRTSIKQMKDCPGMAVLHFYRPLHFEVRTFFVYLRDI